MQLRRAISVTAWVWFGFIAFATLSPRGGRPELTATEPAFVVLIEHVGAFALLGLLLFFGHPNRQRLICALVICAAIGLELLQLFVPGRDARASDTLEKLVGAGGGMLAAVWLLDRFAPLARRFQHKQDDLELLVSLSGLVLFTIALVIAQNI